MIQSSHRFEFTLLDEQPDSDSVSLDSHGFLTGDSYLNSPSFYHGLEPAMKFRTIPGESTDLATFSVASEADSESTRLVVGGNGPTTPWISAAGRASSCDDIGEWSDDNLCEAPTTFPPAASMRPLGGAKKRKLRSPVWKHFGQPTERQGCLYTACQICNVELPYHNSTTVLDKHLKVKHDVHVRSDGGADETQKTRIEVVRAALQQLRAGGGVYDQADNPWFQVILAACDDRHLPESVHALTTTLRLAHPEAAIVKARLQGVAHVSLSLETKLKCSGDPHVEIAVHFISGPEMVRHTLVSAAIRDASNADALALVCRDAIMSFDLVGKVVAVTSGGALTTHDLVPLLQQKLGLGASVTAPIASIFCLASAINTTVQTAVANVREIQEVLGKCFAWAAFFRDEPGSLLGQLDSARQPRAPPFGHFQMAQITNLAFRPAVVTLNKLMHAYTTTLAARSHDANDGRSQHIYTEISSRHLSHADYQLIQEVKLLLEPFQEAAENIFSVQQPSRLSAILPTRSRVAARLRELARVVETTAAKSLHVELLAIETVRFSDDDNDLMLKVAVVLDPTQHTEHPHAAPETIAYIQQQLQAGQVAAQRSAPLNAFAPARQDHWQTGPSAHAAGLTELDFYFQAARSNTQGPVPFWHENQSVFPLLYGMASRIFTTPATSIPKDSLLTFTPQTGFFRHSP